MLQIKIAIFALIYFVLVAWSLFGMTKDLRKGLPLLAIITVLASIHPRTKDHGILYEYWLVPLQYFRSESMLLTSAFISMGLVINITRAQWWRFPLPVSLLIIVGTYAGLVRTVHEGAASGLSTLVFALATLVPPAALAIGSLRDREDGERLLRYMGYAGIFWVFGAAVQLVVHQRMAYVRAGLSDNYRFGGLMTNPQHASVYITMIGTLFFHLALNARGLIWKILWFGTLSVTIPMLLATGSRTGAAMLVIGCLPAAITRLGPAALLLPPAGAIAYYGAQFFASGKFGVNTERFLSTENTRTFAWLGLLEKGMESPIVGVGLEEAEFSENSYLLAFASYGVFSLLLTLATSAAAAFLILRLLVAFRRMSADHSRLAVYSMSAIAAYLFGTLLEGYMLSRVNAMHYAFIAMCSVGVFTLRTLKESPPLTDWLADDESWATDDPTEPPETSGPQVPNSAVPA